jgi:prephenate dehydratase
MPGASGAYGGKSDIGPARGYEETSLEKMAIAFQGEHGAYSEEAIYKRFGRGVRTVPTGSIREVFNLAETDAVQLGVVPVENSVEGSINETYDMLVSCDLKVVGEVILRVVHCLIALPSARLSDIKVVYSHPQALAQCRNFVTSMGLDPIVTYDTAGSAKMIKEESMRGAAAIAGEKAAQIYGLKVLKRGIEDYATNATRFLVISKKGGSVVGRMGESEDGHDRMNLSGGGGSGRRAPGSHGKLDPIRALRSSSSSGGGGGIARGGAGPRRARGAVGEGSSSFSPRSSPASSSASPRTSSGLAESRTIDKTSIIFSLPHTPGSLYNALEVFARAKINLTRIESRPTKEHPWEYYFFVDFEGHERDPGVSGVLAELGKKTVYLKILGSYPRSELA